MSEDWTDCWTCEHVFARRRPTARRCQDCQRPYCEGEHGSFSPTGGSTCLRCKMALLDATITASGVASVDPTLAQFEVPSLGDDLGEDKPKPDA